MKKPHLKNPAIFHLPGHEDVPFRRMPAMDAALARNILRTAWTDGESPEGLLRAAEKTELFVSRLAKRANPHPRSSQVKPD